MEQLSNKKTLIVNYSGLKIGGIEIFFVKLMRHSLDKGYRVIWLTNESQIEEAFPRDLIEDIRLEKIISGSGRRLFKRRSVTFSHDEDVTMLSCEPLHFIAGEEIRRKAKVESFFHFLILPHFTGNAYYLERYFGNGVLNRLCFKYMKKLVSIWEKEGCILAFSKQHLDAYEKNYRVTICDKNNKVLKKIEERRDIEKERIVNKSQERKNKFSIITCSRFDFPHKGYILGLIKTFAHLKGHYPELNLTIVGYGEGEKILKEEVAKLPEGVGSAINFTGALLLEELNQAFENSTLNIGVAGALLTGAKCAVPSIPVRHYSYNCEGYGFLEDARSMCLSSEEGQPIEKYILETIQMTDEEYIMHALAAYESAYESHDTDPDFVFRKSNAHSNATTTLIQAIIARVINLACWFLVRFKGAKGYE